MHLKIVSAAQSSSSLGEVAQKLHISPSALSHQLKELQQLLDGQAVLRRRQKSLQLTPLGQRILETANVVLPQLSQLENDVGRLLGGDSGKLRIAIECHSCYQWLMPTLEQFRQQCPDVEIDFVSGMHFNALSGLSAGDVELVVTADPVPQADVSYIPLFDYECVLALPKTHALLQKPWIEAQDLASEVLIIYPVEQQKLDVFRQFLLPAGVFPQALRHAELTMMMMQLVAVGAGVCALPNWAVSEYADRGYVATRPLGAKGVFTTLHLAVLNSSLRLSYIQELILLAKDIPFGTLSGISAPGSLCRAAL